MNLTDLIVPEDIEWVHPNQLRPGDRQVFAGRLLTVAVVLPDGKLRTRVMYDEAPERYWGNGSQVQRLRSATTEQAVQIGRSGGPNGDA